MRVRSLIVAALWLTACARAPEPETAPDPAANSAAGGGVAVRGGRILVERAEDFGVDGLSDAGTRAIVPRVAALVATPNMLSLRVGDTLSLGKALRIVAFDSSGAPLGQLAFYDRDLSTGAARFEGPAQVVGVRAGTGLLRLSFPRRHWTSRADPPAAVAIPITVTPRD